MADAPGTQNDTLEVVVSEDKPPRGGVQNILPHRIKKGEVRNPAGRNQYTYRRDAERMLDAMSKEHAGEILTELFDNARLGKRWAIQYICDRILPGKTERHEHDLPDDGGNVARLIDELATLSRRRREEEGSSESE
jgi:hypothetical protein